MEVKNYLIACIKHLQNTREEINKGFLKNMDEMNDIQKNQLNSILFDLDSCIGTIAEIYPKK